MPAANAPSFQHAARYERDLNDRQRDVLRLIADGCTNGEIAERLALSLAGAKWNVSEILTKLGLDSREQAAAYYRWRTRPHRRASSPVRGLAAVVSWKTGIAAASTAIAVGSLITMWVILSSTEPTDTGPDRPGQPFYLEAKFTREDADHKTGQAARWWLRSATVGRYESDVPRVESARRGFVVDYGQGTSLAVRDGTNQWIGGAAPHYLREELGDARVRPWPAANRVGPVGFATVDDLIADLRSRDGWAEATGTARILGRDVVVVASGPVVAGQAGPRVASGRRYWIDPERMFLMRSESVGGLLRERAEVTLLRYGEEQPDQLFAFAPNAGSTEITCKEAALALSTGALPPGFISLPLVAIPAGFGISSAGVSSARDGTCGSAKIVLMAMPPDDRDGRSLELNESIEDAASLFLSPIQGYQLTDGTPAYSSIDDKGYLALAWMARGLGMQAASNFLTVDELLRFADAVVAAQDSPSALPGGTPSTAVSPPAP